MMDDMDNQGMAQVNPPDQSPVGAAVEIQGAGRYRTPMFAALIVAAVAAIGIFSYAKNKIGDGAGQGEIAVESGVGDYPMAAPKEEGLGSGIFIEGDIIRDWRYVPREPSDYCGDIVKIPSSRCVTHQAGYVPAHGLKGDGNNKGIYVHISEHADMDGAAGGIIDAQFAGARMSPSYINGSKVYVAHTYFGSYYYWLHDNKEILVGATAICDPNFLREGVFDGQKMTGEELKNMKNQCGGIGQISEKYLEKYPSDLIGAGGR